MLCPKLKGLVARVPGAQAAVVDGQPPKSKPKKSDSAKNGGFSHSPCPPWFHEESWKIAYPARTAVFGFPKGFQANPIRGSSAVLSIWTPTRPSEVCPGMRYLPVKKLKFAWRFWASVTGVTSAQASPRFRVRLFVTRQSSWTKGRNIFQRRPVVAPLKVW